MNKMQKQVEEFHKEFGLESAEFPQMLDILAKKRRINLIAEELAELKSALLMNDLVETIDALCDIMYVVLGTAVELGIDLEPFFESVHASNMTKAGGHFNEYGKYIKPDTYELPELALQFYYTYGKDIEDVETGGVKSTS